MIVFLQSSSLDCLQKSCKRALHVKVASMIFMFYLSDLKIVGLYEFFKDYFIVLYSVFQRSLCNTSILVLIAQVLFKIYRYHGLEYPWIAGQFRFGYSISIILFMLTLRSLVLFCSLELRSLQFNSTHAIKRARHNLKEIEKIIAIGKG